MSVRLPAYDALRVAVVAQWLAVIAQVDAVPDDAYALPTRLPGWRVAELVVHLARNPTHLGRMLVGPPGPLPDEAEVAGGTTPVQLRELLAENVATATALLATLAEDRVVAGREPPCTVAAYLPSRCVEGCVHALDLAAATGVPARNDRHAEGIAVRMTLGLLERTAPGRSVEVRVPPHAAVQVVEGPRHTRGTPPNTVEADAPAWLELATGRLSWAEAVADGRVRPSGVRADISPLLPVLT